jgi:ABC-type uncharacterized transport system involved in gliding motility auxiliary subunit
MKSADRFAWIGLLVSGLALLATILLGIVRALATFGILASVNIKSTNIGLSISAALVVIGLASYVLLVPDKVRQFLTGRQARYGSNSLIMVLAFVGILIVVNVLVFQHPQRWDLTENQQHTLAPETLNALKSLPDNVTALAFFSQNRSTDTARNLLNDIKANSNGKFDYKFIDPELDPLAARQAGVTGDGKIVLEMGNQKEIAALASEQEIVSAMIRLINPESKAVYFLTGHGERDVNNTGDTSITRARSTLVNKNYQVKTLNLLAENKIPDDAKAIVIAGPMQPLSDQEISLLKDYLAKGGGLIVMEDPTILTKFNGANDPLAEMLNQDWGITLNNDLVVDPSSQNYAYAIAYQYANHPITQKLNGVVTFFPFARSLQTNSSPENITQTALIQTVPNAWGETDFQGLQNKQIPEFNQDQDIQGPVNLAFAAQDSKTNARLAVFGNSSFISDQYFDTYGNGDLFVNTIDWTVGQEALINITPKQPVQRTFQVPSEFKLVGDSLTAICILPGLVLLGAVYAWISRRRRG